MNKIAQFPAATNSSRTTGKTDGIRPGGYFFMSGHRFAVLASLHMLSLYELAFFPCYR